MKPELKKLLKYNLTLLSSLLFLSTFFGCFNGKNEEVLERYPSGAKYIVGVYEGTGVDEKFIERHFFQENGKLGRIEYLQEESTTTYLDLYPETNTAQGLEDFLDGSWFAVEKIPNNRYDVYETYSIWFEDSKLQREIDVIICDGMEKVKPPPAILISNVSYQSNLTVTEEDIHFFNTRPTNETWSWYVNKYNLDPIDFNRTLLAELGNIGSSVDQKSLLGKYITLNEISIDDNSIGETFKPLHGTQVELGDEANYYFFEKGIGRMKVYEVKKSGKPNSCDSFDDYFK